MSEQLEYTYEKIAELYHRFNPSAVEGDGAKVLVAEDNDAMRRLICRTLEAKGFSVVQAADGLEAIKLIKEHGPDLLLLDIQMPKATGLAVLEAVRKDERFALTPVIMVTARKTKQDILVAQHLGVTGYIIKPYKMDDLLQKVREALGG